MKRKFFIWGVTLFAAGWLLFRFGEHGVLPAQPHGMDLRQFWAGLTVHQKLAITGLELPFYAGAGCLLVSLFLAISKK